MKLITHVTHGCALEATPQVPAGGHRLVLGHGVGLVVTRDAFGFVVVPRRAHHAPAIDKGVQSAGIYTSQIN
jgi:hypothetical protein